MKGLLRKDYYLIQSVLYIMLLVLAIIGISMSYLTSPWVLTVISTIVLGMITTTTINIDRASGWRKVSAVMPVSKQTLIDSKYLLYLLLTGTGLLLGVLLGAGASLLKTRPDDEGVLIYICISIALAMISGSLTIPCGFLLGEDKNTLVMILVYPLAAAIFIAAVLLFPNREIACAAVAAAGILLFILSWIIARRWIPSRDLV